MTKKVSLSLLLTLLGTAVLFFPEPAHAQNLSTMLTSTHNNFLVNFRSLFIVVSYISGIFLGLQSIFKFKDHVDNPNQTKISDPVKRLLAGGAFLAVPTVINAVTGSLGIGPGGKMARSDPGSWTGGNSGSLDELAVAVISDIRDPLGHLIGGFSWLAGIAFILVGISRLTKTSQEGPRGPAGIGTIFTFLTGGALMSADKLMGVFTSSMFGDTTTSTNAILSPSMQSAMGNAVMQAKVETVIEVIMTFIMIVGYIAFVRGLFVLKAFADGGNQSVSMAQALTFLLGGALAVNLGDLVNVIQNTLGLTILGVSFG